MKLTHEEKIGRFFAKKHAALGKKDYTHSKLRVVLGGGGCGDS